MLKQDTEENNNYGIVFIGEKCIDLIMSAAGILAKMGQVLNIIDISSTGELFEIAAGYGGRTNRTVAFRNADYIRCKDVTELNLILFSKNRERGSEVKENPTMVWIYIDPQSFYGKTEDCLKEKIYKKIVIADSFSYAVKQIIYLIRKESFRANLFLLRGLPGKKITFSYFCRVYQKEFGVFQKIQELPWAEEDLEYRVRLEYEPSQGFMKLSEGYHQAVEEICLEAGNFKKTEIRKAFRSFEKNER